MRCLLQATQDYFYIGDCTIFKLSLSPPCPPLLFIVWETDCASVHHKEALLWMFGVLYELAAIIATNCSAVSKALCATRQ